MAAESTEVWLGRYALTRRLGAEGSFIESWAARQQGMDREVELRVLAIPGGARNPLFIRFVHETKVLAGIDHPSVVPVLDHGVVDGRPYFTTPLRTAVRAREHLAERGGRLPAEEVLQWAEILTDALQQIHDAGLLHRGISTTSVWFDRDRRAPYIGECSAMKDVRASLSAQGVPQLTELIPTPEGLAGQPLDHRTDVFLACCLFYELLSGTTPMTTDDVRAAVCGSAKSVPIKPLAPELTAGLEGLAQALIRGLSSDPARRHASAAELNEELRTVAQRRTVRLLVENTARLRTRRPPSEATKRPRAEAPISASAAHPSQVPWQLTAGLGAVTAVALLVAAAFSLRTPLTVAPLVQERPTPTAAPRGDEQAALRARVREVADALPQTPIHRFNFMVRLTLLQEYVRRLPPGKPLPAELDEVRRAFTSDQKAACRRLEDAFRAAAGR